MAGNFLTRSRHGTVYYFRRRVPKELHAVIGKPFLVRSLETGDRRTAIVRARSLAVQTDLVFQRTLMTTKNTPSGGLSIDLTYELDIPGLGKLKIDAEPEECEAAESMIRTTIEAATGTKSSLPRALTGKLFEDAINEYNEKAQPKAQSKATYRSKLEHARRFFGGTTNIFDVGQADLVRYCDHVSATIPNITSQGLYISTVASFLNWHRSRVTGFASLTTKTLIPKKSTPDSDDRDAFTLEQLRLVFVNAQQYRDKSPHKFWVSIAPAFIGCRIEELSQVNLGTDLRHDEEAGIWYFSFDERQDPDGTVRKSMKKVSSWRCAPIHSALVRHGFVDFLRDQERAGFLRPFQQEWEPREVDSAMGKIVKWSHYISRWGGRELDKIGKNHQFDPSKLAYFHSMRHTFKRALDDAGVSSEMSEALSGRRYGGADAERYGKLKQNHKRLALEGIEQGLGKLTALLDQVLATQSPP
jgi:hypothetical protein